MSPEPGKGKQRRASTCLFQRVGVVESNCRLRETAKVLDESLTVAHARFSKVAKSSDQVHLQQIKSLPGLLEPARGARQGCGQMAEAHGENQSWEVSCEALKRGIAGFLTKPTSTGMVS